MSYVEEFDKLWDYNQPKVTEEKFRKILSNTKKADSLEFYLQLKTQIARTLSLQAHFEDAHKILDEIENEITKNTPIAEVRMCLERGRTYNSAKEKEKSISYFLKAFMNSEKLKNDFYAIDAAHMLAIAESTASKQMEWNLKAVEIAERSKDTRARSWLGSLYNNIAWTYHDIGEYQKALGVFQKALKFREDQNHIEEIRIAKWSVARALRSLKRYDEALKIQRELEKEFQALEKEDGYVFEELGELYLVTGNKNEAKAYFVKAYDYLSKDLWLSRNEPKRINRLKELAEIN